MKYTMLVAILFAVACGRRPMDLTVMNLSDEEFWVDRVWAPEFAYDPPVGTMSRSGKGTAGSGELVKSPPRRVTVTVRGRGEQIIAVPPLPSNVMGRPELIVEYTRSRRWIARWEVRSTDDSREVLRFIPDDSDPRFRLHRELVQAAETGQGDRVESLLKRGALVHWDTTSDDPLLAAALHGHSAVIDLLLANAGERFDSADVDEAVRLAADANETDISALRLLITRVGNRVTVNGRAQALHAAAESHLLDPATGRILPAGPAVRFLIEDAGYDINTPVTDCGHTILDIAEGPPAERHRDRALIEYLKAHGAKHGTCR